MADVFISYSRRKQTFAQELQEALAGRGKEAWVDLDGIRKGAEWEREVLGAIEAADSFVFVLTPESVASKECEKEAEHAEANGKRIVPVLQEPVDPHLIPKPVAKIQWVDFSDGRPLETAVAELVETLETDLEWVKLHTDLQVDALEWDREGRDRGRLLRGAKLQQAERWLTAAHDEKMAPTALQGEYILASRRAATRRQRLGILAALGVAVVSLALGAIALLQRNEARNQEELALSREQAATSIRLSGEDPELALLLAAVSAETRSTDESREALINALGIWPLIASFRGDDESLSSAAVAAGRRYAVSGSPQNIVRRWDLVTGRSVVIGSGVPLALRAAVGPDGRVLTAGAGGAHLWPPSGGRPLILPEPTHAAAAAFRADGKQVITGDLKGDVRVWNLARRRIVAVLPGRATQRREGPAPRRQGDQIVQDVAVSPNGRLAAAAYGTRTAYVWDVNSGRFLWKLQGSKVAFSPDGKLLAAAFGFTAFLWDVESRRVVGILANHTGDVQSVRFSPSGERLVTASNDRTARVWDVAARRQVAVLPHSSAVLHAEFSPDGEVVATATQQGRLSIWDRDQSAPKTVLGDEARAAVFVGRGNRLAAADRTGARIVDARIGATLAKVKHGRGRVLDLDVSADGRQLATVGEDRSLRLFDPQDARQLWRARLPVQANAVTFSPDGRRLVTAGRDGTARVWDTRGRRLLRTIRYSEPLTWAGLAADERFTLALFGIGEEAAFAVWRGDKLVTDKLPASLTEFSLDGRTAVVLDSEAIRLVDVPSDKQTVIDAPAADVTFQNRAVFSGDGRLLLTAGLDRIARIWDVQTRRIVARIPRGLKPVSGAAFTADGRLVAIGRRDGDVTLYETKTGRRVLSLATGQVVAYMRFNATGDALAVIDQAGRARLIGCDACLPASELASLARRRATRPLTAAERARYLHE